MIPAGNLHADATAGAEERFDTLATAQGLRLERIVSTGHASPPDFWYDQQQAEFVLLVAGAATLRLEAEAEPRHLVPGDWLVIPPRCRHRVEWTQAEPPTIWLAAHFPA